MKSFVLLLAVLVGANIVTASAQTCCDAPINPGTLPGVIDGSSVEGIDSVDGDGSSSYTGGSEFYPCSAGYQTKAAALPTATPSPAPASFARTWKGLICNRAWQEGQITFTITAGSDQTLGGTWRARSFASPTRKAALTIARAARSSS
jgi:hypothetical protein